MAVRVIIGDQEKNEKTSPVVSKVEMVIRRTMDGDYMIMDHTEVDIIVMPKSMKVVAFPKDLMSDMIYGTENRLFRFLSSKGLIEIGSIQAGSIYGSLEARLLKSDNFDTVKMTILNLQKWIDEERPYFEFSDKLEDMVADRFVDPNDEESTELGEIPHDTTKGALQPMRGNAHHWMSYTYE
tara:strand:+ start:777 stop:1322 length:546 start_codon:yes stop_codon:yes gene_type:complete